MLPKPQDRVYRRPMFTNVDTGRTGLRSVQMPLIKWQLATLRDRGNRGNFLHCELTLHFWGIEFPNRADALSFRLITGRTLHFRHLNHVFRDVLNTYLDR